MIKSRATEGIQESCHGALLHFRALVWVKASSVAERSDERLQYNLVEHCCHHVAATLQVALYVHVHWSERQGRLDPEPQLHTVTHITQYVNTEELYR